MLSESWTEIYAAEAMMADVTARVDRGESTVKHAAAFKNALVVSDVSMHASLSCCKKRLASDGSKGCGF